MNSSISALFGRGRKVSEATKVFREVLRQFLSLGPPLTGTGKRREGARNRFNDEIGSAVGDVRCIPWPCTPYRSLRLRDNPLKKVLSSPGSFAHRLVNRFANSLTRQRQ